VEAGDEPSAVLADDGRAPLRLDFPCFAAGQLVAVVAVAEGDGGVAVVVKVGEFVGFKLGGDGFDDGLAAAEHFFVVAAHLFFADDAVAVHGGEDDVVGQPVQKGIQIAIVQGGLHVVAQLAEFLMQGFFAESGIRGLG